MLFWVTPLEQFHISSAYDWTRSPYSLARISFLALP